VKPLWPHDDGPMTQRRREALMHWVAAECIVAERLDPDDTMTTAEAIAGHEDEVRAEWERISGERPV
jgi:hypothetical protein